MNYGHVQLTTAMFNIIKDHFNYVELPWINLLKLLIFHSYVAMFNYQRALLFWMENIMNQWMEWGTVSKAIVNHPQFYLINGWYKPITKWVVYFCFRSITLVFKLSCLLPVFVPEIVGLYHANQWVEGAWNLPKFAHQTMVPGMNIQGWYYYFANRPRGCSTVSRWAMRPASSSCFRACELWMTFEQPTSRDFSSHSIFPARCVGFSIPKKGVKLKEFNQCRYSNLLVFPNIQMHGHLVQGPMLHVD